MIPPIQIYIILFLNKMFPLHLCNYSLNHPYFHVMTKYCRFVGYLQTIYHSTHRATLSLSSLTLKPTHLLKDLKHCYLSSYTSWECSAMVGGYVQACYLCTVLVQQIHCLHSILLGVWQIIYEFISLLYCHGQSMSVWLDVVLKIHTLHLLHQQRQYTYKFYSSQDHNVF